MYFFLKSKPLGPSSKEHSLKIRSQNQAVSTMWELMLVIKIALSFIEVLREMSCVSPLPPLFIQFPCEFFIFLAHHGGREVNYTAKWWSEMPLSSAWRSRCVCSAWVYVRAAVRTTGQGSTLHHKRTVWVLSGQLMWYVGASEWAEASLRPRAIGFRALPCARLSQKSRSLCQYEIMGNSYFVT